MRKLIYSSFILVIVACSPKVHFDYVRTAAVEFVSGDKNTITVDAHGAGHDFSTASLYAERNALENILFRGIPGSNQENPMISNETEALRNHRFAMESLILKNGYRRYMIESYNHHEQKSGQAYHVRRIIKWDLQALRKHLEDEKIVRKFGL